MQFPIPTSRRSRARTILAVAGALALARSAHAASVDSKTFDLVAAPGVSDCLAAYPGDPTRPPTAAVTVRRGRLNDQLQIQLRNMKEGLAFDLFTVERSSLRSDGTADPDFKNKGGFGLAWYQSDLEIQNNHRDVTSIRTILVDQIFGFDAAIGLKPTNTFHVGFWFNDPNDAVHCGFQGPATPFNGEHNAGPLAMISVPDPATDLGPLCLSPDLSTDPVRCNP